MLPHLIETYGYLAILIGTFLEGETILILGGFAAHQGYLNLAGVIAAAFSGTLCSDQLFFYLGRKHAGLFLDRHPARRNKVETVNRILKRYGYPILLSFRFLYGLRTVTPFAVGMSAFPAVTFLVLNVASAVLWAIVLGAGGYFFGRVLEATVGRIKEYELYVLLLVASVGICLWLWHFYRHHKVRNHS